MVKRVFFEFLPFIDMKVCLQCVVSKAWLFGAVVSFEILETFLSPGHYSTNNAYDIQNTLENYFLVTIEVFAMSKTSISSKNFKLFKLAKHFLSFQKQFSYS